MSNVPNASCDVVASLIGDLLILLTARSAPIAAFFLALKRHGSHQAHRPRRRLQTSCAQSRDGASMMVQRAAKNWLRSGQFAGNLLANNSFVLELRSESDGIGIL